METKENIRVRLQAQVGKGIEDALEYVLEARKKYFQENPASRPKLPEAEKIIESYSNTAAMVSGGVSLIPGPMGMMASIPEVILVIKSQLSMIYDLSVAYQKENLMNKELMLGIFLSTSGVQGLQLITGEGGKILVQSSSLVVVQKITAVLGAEITETLLANMVAKWLPVVGASAMAAWSKYATMKLGKKAVSILERDIQISAKPITVSELPAAALKIAPPTDANYESQKIQVLINLMKIDKNILPAEKEFLQKLIEQSQAPNKKMLLQKLDSDQICDIDYSTFSAYPERTVDLIIDMVAFSKIDSSFALAERIYLRKVCKELGLTEAEIAELLQQLATPSL